VKSLFGIKEVKREQDEHSRGVLMEKEKQKHNQKRLTNAFNHRAALSRLTRYLAGEKFLRNPLDWQKRKRDARFKFLLNGFPTSHRGCFIWHPMMHVKIIGGFVFLPFHAPVEHVRGGEQAEDDEKEKGKVKINRFLPLRFISSPASKKGRLSQGKYLPFTSLCSLYELIIANV
jgi:hypothetical protein